MRRIQFMEIEDQPWCPGFIRQGITDYLTILWWLAVPKKPMIARLRRAMEACGENNIVDLCSGGGGPWEKLLPEFLEKENIPVKVTLTDLHPNKEAFALRTKQGGGALGYCESSVDATDVPKELSGVRTIFGAFHHFPPDLARAILVDAADKGQGIAIFEPIKRSWPVLLACPTIPLSVMLATPLIRPFRWSRLFWTYLAPLIPLAALFDGTVSCLRAYSVEDLKDMTNGLGGYDFHWEINADSVFPLPIPNVSCIGFPKPPAPSSSE